MKRATNRWVGAAALLTFCAGIACGGSSTFRLTSEDNNAERLGEALAMVEAPEAGQPLNRAGKPLVYAVIEPQRKKGAEVAPAQLVAFDLADKKTLWKTDGPVRSRVVAGGTFVAHLDGDNRLVAYDNASGALLWRHPLGSGTFLGACADRDRVFYLAKVKEGGKTSWNLIALDGATGRELWNTPSPGQLGTPVARGGLIFSPFLKQWLVILDARTGAQLARIRGLDQGIAFVRSTPGDVYFGSKEGVFLLDQRSASGTTRGSTYGQAELPKELRTFYHWDAFDPVQASYSAYDKNRLLWRGRADGDALRFQDDRIVVHAYRFFFGFDSTNGNLVWAYNHPRVYAVASAHLGAVVAVASGSGEVIAIDPENGRRHYRATIPEAKARSVRGATFDAEGWSPSETGGANDTARALVSIARDRDRRFTDVKLFSLTALGGILGGDVTADLIALVQADKTPAKVHDKAVQVLIARKDPSGVPHLVRALAVPYDYIEGNSPRAVGVMARALAAMGDLSARPEVTPALRGEVLDALVTHLYEPRTPRAELVEIVKALGATGLEGALAPLRSFLLTYRADPAFAKQAGALTGAIDAMLRRGATAERELIAFVAEDQTTLPAVAAYARTALQQARKERPKNPDRRSGAQSAEAEE